MTKKDKQRIDAVEMDCLRRTRRISRQELIQNQKTEKKNTYNNRKNRNQIVNLVRTRERLHDTRWPKRAFEYIPSNKREKRKTSTHMEQGNNEHNEKQNYPQERLEGQTSKTVKMQDIAEAVRSSLLL